MPDSMLSLDWDKMYILTTGGGKMFETLHCIDGKSQSIKDRWIQELNISCEEFHTNVETSSLACQIMAMEHAIIIIKSISVMIKILL